MSPHITEVKSMEVITSGVQDLIHLKRQDKKRLVKETLISDQSEI
jgi:hypothetical protein